MEPRSYGQRTFEPPMNPYEQLLHLAFADRPDAAHYLTDTTRQAHARLRAAPPAEQPFRFEQMRLGTALALIQLLAQLGDHDESRQVLALLHRALAEAQSPADIDRIVGREAKLFDELYDNLYVNEQGEELLDLFARTLDAQAVVELEDITIEAATLAQNLDFSDNEDEA